MIVMGVVLLLVVGVFSVAMLRDAGDAVDLSVLGFDVETNVRMVFLLGVGALLVFVLASWLIIRGVRHSAQRRRQVRRLRQEVETRGTETPGDRPRPQVRPAPRGTADPYDGPDPYGGHFDSTPRD